MSVRYVAKFASHKRGSIGLAVAVATTCFAGALTMCATAVRAQSAGGILKSMLNVYSSAKSYSAIIVTHQAGKAKDGQKFSLVKTQQFKFKSPNSINIKVNFVGQGVVRGKVEVQDQLLVGSGPTLIAYSPVKKQYAKGPNRQSWSATDILDFMKHLPTADQPNVKLVSPSTVNGRAVSVVEISPVMPATLTPDQQKQWKQIAAGAMPLKLFIDKQNFSLLRLTEAANGNTVDVSLQDQLFNVAIPDSEFKYTPPPGAKEMVPSQGSFQGSAPGRQQLGGGAAPKR